MLYNNGLTFDPNYLTQTKFITFQIKIIFVLFNTSFLSLFSVTQTVNATLNIFH
jgi:hypothetical protein